MKYVKLEKLGSGSYGDVYKGQDHGFPKSYLREISLLKSFEHENIVQLIDTVWENDSQIYLIFEFLVTDLRTYLDDYKPNGFEPEALKNYFYQITKGIEYCHKRAILHRDLKLENVLIDKFGNIKIADFGLSRAISIPVPIYTPLVVTLWYRAPELLLKIASLQRYACGLDVWSLGCVFAEMESGNPLFDGDSEIDQIRQIFRVLGTPTEEIWPGITNFNFNGNEKRPTSNVQRSIYTSLEMKVKLTGSAFELLEKMLKYNPNKRITASKILKHEYFNGFDPNLRYPPVQQKSNDK